jgi:hypothetical protein
MKWAEEPDCTDVRGGTALEMSSFSSFGCLGCPQGEGAAHLEPNPSLCSSEDFFCEAEEGEGELSENGGLISIFGTLKGFFVEIFYCPHRPIERQLFVTKTPRKIFKTE